MSTVPISVMIPTCNRPQRLLQTLSRIAACEPLPREVIVHIDGGDEETHSTLATAALPVRILQADTRVGPGGGRNRMMREATNELLLSLDDDSYPVARECFSQIMQLAEARPEFALFALPALLPGVAEPTPATPIRETIAFVGSAAVLRRSAVATLAGYLPLRYAYGMEETDMVLQLLDAGYALARADRPCMRHDISPAHRSDPAVDRAWLVNTALLPFLRYPWPYVLLLPPKVLRRLLYSIRRGHAGPALAALTAIAPTLWKYRHVRAPVTRAALRHYLRVQR